MCPKTTSGRLRAPHNSNSCWMNITSVLLGLWWETLLENQMPLKLSKRECLNELMLCRMLPFVFAVFAILVFYNEHNYFLKNNIVVFCFFLLPQFLRSNSSSITTGNLCILVMNFFQSFFQLNVHSSPSTCPFWWALIYQHFFKWDWRRLLLIGETPLRDHILVNNCK